MRKLIQIGQLCSVCLTRERGAEAYRKLRPRLESGPVELDLTGASPSTSFLDEMVCRLRRVRALSRVTFVTNEDRVKRKLSQIAGVRQAAINFSEEPGAAVRAVPRSASTPKRRFEANKSRAFG